MFKTCRIGCNIADFSYATSKHHASNFPRVFLPKKILPSEKSKIWLFWPILKFLISRKLPCRNWKFAVNWYKNLRKSHLHQRVRSFFFELFFFRRSFFLFVFSFLYFLMFLENYLPKSSILFLHQRWRSKFVTKKSIVFWKIKFLTSIPFLKLMLIHSINPKNVVGSSFYWTNTPKWSFT